jgi:hypothetical protein
LLFYKNINKPVENHSLLLLQFSSAAMRSLNSRAAGDSGNLVRKSR